MNFNDVKFGKDITGKFFAEFKGTDRPIGNFKQESYLRACHIFEQNSKIILGFSGSIEDQAVLNCFLQQEIPIKCAFMYLPGYNEAELENVRLVEEKNDIKVDIVDINIHSYYDELLEESASSLIPGDHLIHKKFLSMLPTDYAFVQGIDNPGIVPINGDFYFCKSPNQSDILRSVAFKSLARPGKEYKWNQSREMIISITNDDSFKAYQYTVDYFLGNGVLIDHQMIDHWDIYVKPMILSTHWGDDLIYFPKIKNSEIFKSDMSLNDQQSENGIKIPLRELLHILQVNSAEGIT